MKITLRHTYILTGAVLILSSCAQEDMPDRITTGESNQIVFRTSLPELSSRASVTTAENLSSFYVTAFDFDDPETFKNGIYEPLCANVKAELSSDEQSYVSPECLWPGSGKGNHTVSFFAFNPGRQEGSDTWLVNPTTSENVDYKLTGFRVAGNIAEQVDLITAYATGSTIENEASGITLPFVHQLSRIDVQAWSAHESCDIEIAGVRIGGVRLKGTFNFPVDNGFGTWSDLSDKGIVEYIYGEGERIVELNKGNASTSTEDGAVSIMGTLHNGGNSAMMIPSAYQTAWDHVSDKNNTGNNLYISVLLRVTDATPSAGINPLDKQRYPYGDILQGEDALEIPRVYLAVEKATHIVSCRLYKEDGKFFTDEKCRNPYTLSPDEEIKEFGWAAIPVTGVWDPGHAYTYVLNYSYGVGLHDPEVSTAAPKAGDPIFSDEVMVGVTIEDWSPDRNVGDLDVPGS